MTERLQSQLDPNYWHVIFTADEWAIGMFAGAMIYKAARKSGRGDGGTGVHTGLEISGYGMIGEWAFSKFTGLPMNLTIGPDDGYDFVTRGQGLKVDVKSSPVKHYKPNLLVETTEVSNLKADIYVLVWLYPERFSATLIGYATKEDMLLATVKHDLPIPSLLYPWQDLKPISRW